MRARELHSSDVEVPAVSSEQLQTVGDRLAGAAEDSRRLTVRDLRYEGADQTMDELWLPEAEVDAEGLRRESAMAFQAEESLDGSAVTRPLKRQRLWPVLIEGQSSRGQCGGVNRTAVPFSQARPGVVVHPRDSNTAKR
jgi:hypothetical protein